ncbi:MAG: SIMPL domain-containing protein [Rhizobiaceae bacterium]
MKFTPISRRNTTLPGLAIALALTIVAPLHLAMTPAQAQETMPKAQMAVISVSATGSATAVPDLARLDLSVQREAKTARAALDANNKAMADVLKAMRDAGIEDRDLQTSNFNIQPRYHYPKSSSGRNKPPILVGYIVTNSLTVRVRDLNNLGAILDRSVSLGVNSGGGISFSSDRPEPIIEQARKNAVAKAITKAKTLTEAAGVKLGRIVEISETNRQPPRPRAMARMESAMAADAAVPIAAGENSYSITVNIKWELDQ